MRKREDGLDWHRISTNCAEDCPRNEKFNQIRENVGTTDEGDNIHDYERLCTSFKWRFIFFLTIGSPLKNELVKLHTIHSQCSHTTLCISLWHYVSYNDR